MLSNQVSLSHQIINLHEINHAKDLFQKHAINYLYHITSIDNLPSIFFHGLVSHNHAHSLGLNKTDISDNDVQNIRQYKSVNGISLHNYVPLYFNPKNPMLFKRRNLQENIAILAITPIVLMYSSTLFTDGNAACRATNFYQDITMLSELDWDTIREKYWHNKSDGKRISCAEILVYPHLSYYRILKVFCYSNCSAHRIANIIPSNINITIEVKKNLYF